jgi:hypothetical protein
MLRVKTPKKGMHMKKNLLMSALVFGSLGLTATASGSCVVELQYQGSILGQNIFEEANCREALKQCKITEKRYERDHLLPNEEMTCVNLGGSSDPIPEPTPDPIPEPTPDPIPEPTPMPSYAISVSGFIEGTAIELSGYSTGEVYNKCLDMVEARRIRSVDDMMISINGHKFEVLRNTTSYWNSAEAICNRIDAEMTPYRMAPVQNELYPISVIGKLESSLVNYSGLSIADVFNSCVLDVKSRRIGNVDDMMISVNGHRYTELRNNSSYWNSPVQICSKIDQLVDSFRLTPIYPMGYLNAEGRFENTNFSFTGQSADEVFNSCVDFVGARRIGNVDDIYISINNSRRERFRNSSSYWGTPVSICSAALKNIL